MVSVVAALIAGCTIGPEYVRPTVDLPPAWRIDYAADAEVANTR
jgi:outer membrane protein, multidrug efflux system